MFEKFFQRKGQAVPDFEMEPRAHHYEFAHRFLPSVAHARSKMLLEGFADEDAQDRLVAMWNWLGEQLPAEDRLAPDGLDVGMREHGDNTIFLFTFPVPRAVTEAYFTALVFGPTATAEKTEIGQQSPMRYYTLEYGFSLEPEEKRTVLGAWDYSNGGISHLNMGTGPEPELEAFFNRVCVLLD